MLTSDAVDLFGADREAARELRPYLSRQAFERGGVFSYRTYLAASFLARMPQRTKALRRMRRNANKLIMYMMQAHMLDHMFVAEPQWAERSGSVGQPEVAISTATPAGGTNRRFA